MSWLSRLVRAFRRSAANLEPHPATPRAQVEWIVVGLGNPGSKYADSRHNCGRLVLNRIARAKSVVAAESRFHALTAELELAGCRVLLLAPETYYNRSGESVAAVLQSLGLPLERLIVVHDELDLPPGRLRIKRGGSDAGNRGIRSISETLGSPDFIRVRVGVGPPPSGEPAPDYLLRPMSPEECNALALDSAAEAVPVVIADGLERAMGRFNRRE